MSTIPEAGALRRLTKRSQFLRAARGRRSGRLAFSLQVHPSEQPEPGIGLTVTKKTGNSPARSRIKRRLRAVAKACAAGFHPQHDYVLVARREMLSEPFSSLVGELGRAIDRVHADKTESRNRKS